MTLDPLPIAKALVAEDEPVLARNLVKMLDKLWPALRIEAVVHDGDAAVDAAQRHRPDVIFLDIKMPECSGLEAAQRIADDWPAESDLPLIVFVTAFDRFAIDAFEREAVDYVLKPVETERLALTCQRLANRLAERQRSDDSALAPLRALLQQHMQPPPPHAQQAPLTLLQAGIGSTLHMVPVSEVHYFEADDKYVRVVTSDRALLIRTPLRELMPRLDATQFMQIHRGTVVRTALIDKVVREESGRTLLHLKGREERLAVSRSYAHMFRAM